MKYPMLLDKISINNINVYNIGIIIDISSKVFYLELILKLYIINQMICLYGCQRIPDINKNH